MKLLIIGIGDCGCRLAGEFARLNRRAKVERHVNIITSAYAVNNDRKQLSKLTRARTGGLRTVPVDGPLEAGGSSEVSAQFMRERVDRITEAIRDSTSEGLHVPIGQQITIPLRYPLRARSPVCCLLHITVGIL